MRILSWVLFAAASATSAGCSFNVSGPDDDDDNNGIGADSGPGNDSQGNDSQGNDDSGTADPPCMVDGFDFCGHATPPGPAFVIATDTTLDTDTDARCETFVQTGGPSACLLYAASISVVANATLRVVGARALILASEDTIVIDGSIDGSSYRGGTTGPNASFATGCAALTSPENDQGGAGGGGGGSFRGGGGTGGTGDTDNSFGNDGDAPGGTPAAAVGAAPEIARGGCAGTKGGNQSGGGGQGGVGGASGGAVWMRARRSIDVPVTGTLRVTGAGGSGGAVQSGGGGGGSGGYLRLAAPTLGIAGALVANGGGAGGGGCFCNGVSVAGGPGEDGHPDASAALGGEGADVSVGDGGNGSSESAIVGQPGVSTIVGAGGGGGGAGFIVLVGSASITGVVSPAAQ